MNNQRVASVEAALFGFIADDSVLFFQNEFPKI